MTDEALMGVKMRRVIFVFVGMAFSCLSVTGDLSEGAPEGRVYSYKKEGGVAHEIEIHFPKDHDRSKPVPGIIMFHGGGWSKGDRISFRYLCHYFASRGLVAATANYRLGKGKRLCITDAKSAIRWYKQNAAKLGVDPKRIIAGGGSAGGHIALLATTNPGLNDPSDSKEYDTSVVAYLLFNPALKPKKDMEVTFEKHIKAAMPPMIAFWGAQDNWLTGWKSACEKMQSLENESIEWWTAQGQSHAFFNKQPWKDLTIIAADQFLKKHRLIEGIVTLPAPENGLKLIKTL